MAKYKTKEASRVWAQNVLDAELEEIDTTGLDMIGYFLWKKITSKKHRLTKKEKQIMIFTTLVVAFKMGLSREDGDEITEEFYEFIESLEITPDTAIRDLMGW